MQIANGKVILFSRKDATSAGKYFGQFFSRKEKVSSEKKIHVKDTKVSIKLKKENR